MVKCIDIKLISRCNGKDDDDSNKTCYWTGNKCVAATDIEIQQFKDEKNNLRNLGSNIFKVGKIFMIIILIIGLGIVATVSYIIYANVKK